MRQQRILFVTTVAILTVGWLIWCRTKSMLTSSQPSQFIRTVSGLPQDVHGWDIFTLYGKLFAYPIRSGKPPFTIYQIDPVNEQVVKSIVVDQMIDLQAVIAKHYQTSDAWLADQGFFMWEIDQQRNIAYATKPSKLPTNVEEFCANGFEGIYVINMTTREVKNFIEHPGFLHMILHPSGKKLYIEAPEGKVKVLDTEKLEWIKEFFVAGYIVLHFNGFSNDARYLFCSYAGGGLIVIDTIEDKVEEWGEQVNNKAHSDYSASFRAPFALSEDKQEIYGPAAFVDIANIYKLKGGVISIDLTQKKINRVLVLSQESECLSAVVMNTKLFISSWESIFVIDIDRWRQGQ